MMPRSRRFKAELLNNGTHTAANGVELGRIDLVEGLFVINEPALYKWLLSTSFSEGKTPFTKINQVFGPSGSWKPDPIVSVTILSMEQRKLIEVTRDVDGDIKTVRPIMPYTQAVKKLERYTTRAEQVAGLEPLSED